RRTGEIGLRIALGASRSDVIRLVMAGALLPAIVGAALGVGLALAASRLVASLLFGVTPTDPPPLPAPLLLIPAPPPPAPSLPARRAAGLDRQTALRCE